MEKEELSKNPFTHFPLLVRNAWKVIRIVWEEQRILVSGIVFFTILIGLIPFAGSGALALIINELTAGIAISEKLILLIALLILSYELPGFLYAIKGYLDKLFWRQINEQWELKLLKKRADLDIARYEDPEFQNLLNRVNERGVWVIGNMAEGIFSNTQNIIGVVVASVILFIAEPLLFIVVTVALIPVFYVKLKYGREVWGIYDAKAEDRRKYWDLRQYFTHTPSLIELILFQGTEKLLGNLKKLLGEFNESQRVNDTKIVWLEMGALIVSAVTTGASIVWIVIETVEGRMEIGTMTFVLSSIFALSNALSGFFLALANQYEQALFAEDLFKLFDTPSVIQSDQKGSPVGSSTPEVVFENMSFAYPGTEKLILENISLTIQAGEKLAIVGVNGAGKTTLIKLLCRIYDPTEGRILINGVDLKKVNLSEWRKIIGVLFQDFTKYNFVVKEGIAMGDSSLKIDDDQVNAASLESESHEFIETWKHQYDEQIGKEFGGIDPSKGQLQKLALARIFFRDPKIMVLDEPTASIDAESEAKIFDRLEKGPQDRTTILISHRFSTVRNADRILVLDGGSVVELGSHTELLEKDGIYARLFRLQAKGYET